MVQSGRRVEHHPQSDCLIRQAATTTRRIVTPALCGSFLFLYYRDNSTFFEGTRIHYPSGILYFG
jgi:hypothetical protein